MGFRELQLGVIADRRSKPQQSDLISLLCHSEINGERLDDESIVQETLLILIGGDETTRHVITGGHARAVRRTPTSTSSCATNRGRCRPASRRCCGGCRRSRTCRAPWCTTSSCAGETLHAGDQLILMYPSANRDADEFPDPFTFDVRRDPNQHIAFGFGPHYCLGQALARLELNVMFDVLFHRLPDLEPAGDGPLPYRASNFIVGPEAMPVRFTPTSRLN